MSIKSTGHSGPVWPQPTDSFATRFQARANELLMLGCDPQDAHIMLAEDLATEVKTIIKRSGKEAAANLIISVLGNMLKHEDKTFYNRSLVVTCLEKINEENCGLLSTDVGDQILGYLYNNAHVGTEEERDLLKREIKVLIGHGFFAKMDLERYFQTHRHEMEQIDRTKGNTNLDRPRRYQHFVAEELQNIHLSENAHRRLRELQERIHRLDTPIQPPQKAFIPAEGKTVRNPPPSSSKAGGFKKAPPPEAEIPPVVSRSSPPAAAKVERREAKAPAAASRLPSERYDTRRMPPFREFYRDYIVVREQYLSSRDYMRSVEGDSKRTPAEQEALREGHSKRSQAYEEMKVLLRQYNPSEIAAQCRESFKRAPVERQLKINQMISSIQEKRDHCAWHGITNEFENSDEPLFEALFFCAGDNYPKSKVSQGLKAMREVVTE